MVSGSDAALNSLFVANAITASVFSGSSHIGSHTGSLLGTASWALNLVGGSSTSDFPYTGSAIISGSLIVIQSGSTGVTVTGSVIISGSGLELKVIGDQQITGSLSISGSGGGGINVLGNTQFSGSVSSLYGYTGSLLGTSSFSTAPISVIGTTLYSTVPAAGPTVSSVGGVFLGSGAGYNSSGADKSVMVGYLAGSQASNALNAVYIGMDAGYVADRSYYAVAIGSEAGALNNVSYNGIFIGNRAGFGTPLRDFNGTGSVFIGDNAGNFAFDSNYAQFIGTQAGKGATSASGSNFIGYKAGLDAASASMSNMFGYQAGYGASSASLSNLFGYNVGATSGIGIGRNNIIIGTNITLPDNYANGINIGGILYGSGSHSTFGTINVSSSVGNGRIGINQPNPQYNLDVSGSGNYTNGLTVSGSTQLTGSLGVTGSAYVTRRILVNANDGNLDGTNPQSLLVSGSNINVIQGEAKINDYAQLNIVNKSGTNFASADVVATNDTGTENGNFIDMGINSSNYNSPKYFGSSNEAYLYNTGSNLYIGNATRGTNANIRFFAGNDGTIFPLVVTGSTVIMTGSLLGSSSYALTASYALNSTGGGLKTKTSGALAATFTGNPKISAITFITAFTDNNYSVVITGEDARTWTIESKTSAGFTINSNSNIAPAGTTYWNATAFGES